MQSVYFKSCDCLWFYSIFESENLKQYNQLNKSHDCIWFKENNTCKSAIFKSGNLKQYNQLNKGHVWVVITLSTRTI